MKNYMVLKCNDAGRLIEEVNNKILEGYIPTGGMAERREVDAYNKWSNMYSQTIYKPLRENR